MRAIRVHEVGGPEVLRLEELPVPEPGPGEVLVRLLAIGVNFIDTYKRKGLYPVPAPFTLGEEGAGVVEKDATRAPFPTPYSSPTFVALHSNSV